MKYEDAMRLFGSEGAVSSINAPLEIFIAELARMSPAQRQMTMEQLGDRVCVFCGAVDPDCPCWLEETAEMPS